MPDLNPVQGNDLPSSSALLRSTIIAAAVALVLLVTVVLPAEYGIDPTRIGRVLGLTEMGEIKMSLAKEAATADSTEAAASAAVVNTVAASGPETVPGPVAPLSAAGPATTPTAGTSPAGLSSHVTEIVLAPNEGKEIKLVMRKDARVTYSWLSSGGVVNYDTHADAPGISYHGYAKGTGKQSDDGVLVAAFDGAHGWFWRNRGRETVTVTLRTNGDYQELKRM